MERWSTKDLGVLAMVGAGNSAPQDPALFAGGTIPFFRTSDVGSIRFGDIETAADYLNEQGARRLRRLPKGTILFPKSGASTFLNHRVMMQVDGCVSSHLATIVAKPGAADPRFLLYFLATIKAQDLVQDHAYPSLNLPLITGIKVPAPPLPEQRRIVAILDEAFEAIATAKANTEKNLQNARELLGRYLATVFGEPGSGWEIRALGEAVRFIDYRGKTPPKREEGIRLITAKNVKMGFIQREPEEFIDPAVYDGWMTRGFPRLGDVLFTTEAPLGNVAQLDTEEKVVIGQRLITMQPLDAALDRTFLKYALMSPPIQASIHAKGTGATVLGIKASLLKTVQIWYPKAHAEQLRLVGLISAVENEASVLSSLASRKRSALDELKKSLLHQAFTGQLTARSADQKLEAVT